LQWNRRGWLLIALPGGLSAFWAKVLFCKTFERKTFARHFFK
jgi:hypothetical protein